MCYVGPPSHILVRIRLPLFLNAVVATLVAVSSVTGILDSVQDSDLSQDVVQLWRMSSFMLALLLAFRLNRVYLRWAAGLQGYSGVGSAALTLAQQALVWVQQADTQLAAEIVRWCCIWPYSMYQTCARTQSLHRQVAELLTEDELKLYHSVPKPRFLVVLQLRQLVELANLDQQKVSRHEKEGLHLVGSFETQLGRGIRAGCWADVPQLNWFSRSLAYKSSTVH